MFIVQNYRGNRGTAKEAEKFSVNSVPVRLLAGLLRYLCGLCFNSIIKEYFNFKHSLK